MHSLLTSGGGGARTRTRMLAAGAAMALLALLVVPATALANPPNISITKTADAASVTAPGQIGFTVTVRIEPQSVSENGCDPVTLQCPAYGVTVSDTLPAGFAWTVESASPADANGTTPPCAISSGVLTCHWGDMTQAFETKSVHVVSPTQLPSAAGTPGTCGIVKNPRATVMATWADGTSQTVISGSASVDVTCPPVLTLVKIVAGTNPPDAATAWTLSASGQSSISGTTGSAAVTNAVVAPGMYTLDESGPTSHYTASTWSCQSNVPIADGPAVDASGNTVTLVDGSNVTCTITNTYTPPPPPNQGFFYFTKTVGGNLSGWTGGTFDFTVTCNGQATSVSLAVPASGGPVSSQVFGPFTPGATCSVAEGTLPAAGAGATWINSPTYSPASSVTIVKNVNVSLSVTNTRSLTPPTTPPTTPPPTPPTTPPTTKPSPSGGVLGATGAPSLPPTSSMPGNGGSSDGNTVGLLLAGLLGVSLTLVVTTRLRGRLLERVDR
jgi:hypothetical protein